MKRHVFSGVIAALIALLAAEPALAARIYNFLPVGVAVVGMPAAVGVNLNPGQRSDSISWPAALAVMVHSGGKVDLPLCTLGFNGHAEIQGGNYMTIGHRGDEIICTVCNSSNQPIARNTRNVARNYFDLNQHPESRTGC